ncbi:MAG: SAM-dependent methyltransferase [Planctomycetes bacterium]|nr:SAM-dependent methyltransferase [Planctomycetota bacterium]
MTTSLETRLVRAAALLGEWRDVLEERGVDGEVPRWAARRGWDGFLCALPDDDLAGCEVGGAAAVASLVGAPADLVALAREVAAVVAVSEASPPAGPAEALKGAPRRKSGQVAALVDLCRARGFAARRIVDVGSGAGHLTRALARALRVEAVGLERDEERVERARARTAGERGVQFEVVAVGATPVALRPTDLAVGLHACGALADALVALAARDRVSLVLVACCPQKVDRAARPAASRTGRVRALDVAREVLGAANSFEGSPDLEALATRIALRRILRARGVPLRQGDETNGLTPRVRRTLEAASARALALRGLAPASEQERKEALELARVEVGVARRRALPRRLLGSALEIALALDRARALEEAGAASDVVRLFPRALSPRNLAVVSRALAR